jgi:hypothetical protein
MSESEPWRVRLTINGAPVVLNEFVESVIGSTVRGMIGALRLDTEPERIVVEIVHPAAPSGAVHATPSEGRPHAPDGISA